MKISKMLRRCFFLIFMTLIIGQIGVFFPTFFSPMGVISGIKFYFNNFFSIQREALILSLKISIVFIIVDIVSGSFKKNAQ